MNQYREETIFDAPLGDVLLLVLYHGSWMFAAYAIGHWLLGMW